MRGAMEEGGGFAAVILAAGKGTRMKSGRAKVLHELAGRPLIDYALDVVREAGARRTIVVVGFDRDGVVAALAGRAEWVEQSRQLGTAHAAMQARELLSGYGGTVVVTCGDMPMLRSGSVRELVRVRAQARAACAVLTFELEAPGAFGRVVRGPGGQVARIVEAKDATAGELALREVNSGTYAFESGALFDALRRVGSENAQGEFYLTDVVGILADEGRLSAGQAGGVGVVAVKGEDPVEMTGVNSAEDLERAERLLPDTQALRLLLKERNLPILVAQGGYALIVGPVDELLVAASEPVARILTDRTGSECRSHKRDMHLMGQYAATHLSSGNALAQTKRSSHDTEDDNGPPCGAPCHRHRRDAGRRRHLVVEADGGGGRRLRDRQERGGMEDAACARHVPGDAQGGYGAAVHQPPARGAPRRHL